ncbi:N-6 DNA methylase [Gramella jeungdoensis]|uniref:site-specific DNA-methyltransferase (adenine-specific) n=1 Tax=Gramella jeungdoensis TaxID=708091 RepID=A0ABT0Z1W3_9FLAO|nr:N-6 DNA methylase [Gramella jeungdoensis]MCM8569702.1 N-6 DNA methylase [Gramella jeungdoensis]
MINQLITNLNNGNIRLFFESKITSFKPEQEVFENIVSEEKPFADPVKIGHAELNNHEELLVFSCAYRSELTARSAKKQQFEIAKKILTEDFKDGAIFIFYDDAGNFRFSFIRKNYGSETSKYSNWKRFTYYVDPLKKNQTFRTRMESCRFDSLDSIQNCFSVEPLSKKFYEDLSYWYFASFDEVEFPNDRKEKEYNLKANAMIRLITRLIFIWFMKQKGLVPGELFEKRKLNGLLHWKDSTGSTYYKAILQNLFFATLNTPQEIGRKFVTSQFGVQNFYRYRRFIKDEQYFYELMNPIPFLNGGLFENLDIVFTGDKENNMSRTEIRIDCFSDNKKNENRLKVPDYLFFGERRADISRFFEDKRCADVEISGLIDILNRYDFTIDENTPEDQEVALDPELLGTVFENLLASYNPETEKTARKESGSFYTPRPIVNYMVKESLECYLEGAVNIKKEYLEQLFDPNEKLDLEKEEKIKIVSALSHIKVLDPACGSGAFPMGCLQHLVSVLNKLDPENQFWKEAQIAKLKAELNNSVDYRDYDSLKENIETIFNNEFNDPDYARKLFLIQNCLYGVDIQPIAMQISKLRFFISLLVEQKTDREKENFGVLPLPNLETKFVAANSLLRLDDGLSRQKGTLGMGKLQNVQVLKKEEELASVREKYFSARTPKTKSKYRGEDKKIREEIASLLIEDGWDNDAAYNIAQWDPFNPNSKAEWFDPEWMFGLKDFDLIIGNPPYSQVKKNTYDKKIFPYSEGKDKGKQNLYKLFVENSFILSRRNGIACMIVQSSLLGDLSATYTRELLLKNTSILKIIEFPKKSKDAEGQVFSSVLQGTCIYIFKKKIPIKNHNFSISIQNNVKTISNPVFEKIGQKELLTIYPDAYYIPLIKENYSQILEKLPAKTFPLSILIREISQGDLNLTTSKKYFSEVISEVKLYRGKNVRRFLLNSEACEFLDEEFLPDQVELNSENEFIVLQEITGTTDKYRLHSCLTVLGESYLFGHTANKILLNDQSLNKLIMGLLNSKFLDWFFRITSTNNHVMGYELKQLPIPNDFQTAQPLMERIIGDIQYRTERGIPFEEFEEELNFLVYSLYDLSYDEILMVDPDTNIIRSDYEKRALLT